MMWVDLNVSVREGELPPLFSRYFEIIRPHAGNSLDAEIERRNPATLLFDFDFPERPGLKLLEFTKKRFASIPIVMMTVQHSESLAVWSFRSRVWDYLVKPVAGRELERCLSSLNGLIVEQPSRRTQRRIRCKASPLPEESRVSPRHTTPVELMPALAYIEKQFRNDVTSGAAAKCCGMDPFRFSRAFKTAFGITFKEYLLRVRIKEACRLLEKPDITIADVASLAGFNDPSYFAKVFKRYAGVTPSAYATSNDRHIILSAGQLDIAHDLA